MRACSEVGLMESSQLKGLEQDFCEHCVSEVFSCDSLCMGVDEFNSIRLIQYCPLVKGFFNWRVMFVS